MKTVMDATPKMSEKQEAIVELKRLFEKSNQIFTICRHVSRSGMSRDISFMIFINNQPYHLNFLINKVLNTTRAMGSRMASGDNSALRVNGCGMDMGYHIVNSLSVALYCEGKYTHEGAYTLPENRWL